MLVVQKSEVALLSMSVILTSVNGK